MKTIVAATDMSANSRPSLRFAIRLAEAMNARLHIVHVHYVQRASKWSDIQYQFYQAKTIQALSHELSAFIRSTQYHMATKPVTMDAVLHHRMDTVSGIIAYAQQKQADYICVGTYGAGLLRRLIGTTTAKLISQSAIPVLSIPATYRRREVSSLLYVSDMANCEAELDQVVRFAKPIGLVLNLLHLYHPYEPAPDKKIIEQTLEQRLDYKVNVHYIPRNVALNLLNNINEAIARFKPSILAMFTNQQRDFIDRIISSSATKGYAFISSLPVLSFPKIAIPETIGQAMGKSTDLTLA